ncbi:PepSY domain-containing protein [Acinetobacter gerneri]|uniref:PepSY domain-containing protein n=1 Tax=Acinetobacter gerneri TaxID=202952 RepID=UPI002936069E|nr:PepSY domain-containing protein [Acinetobacter gerneri]MDV2441538.1 PepSY domain-containing protein [Acinetobacter gerneri]
MLKKFFFQIHWFLGITAGLILSIMGLTGAIFSYEQPIQKWINPSSFTVEVPNYQNKLSPAEIFQHFQKNTPDIKINSITIDQDPSASSSINIVKEGARRGYTMMINPYTAEVLPEVKGREFFAFIQQLHRNLTAGEVGKQITGACTLMLLFFIFSGLYLRWPKKHTWRQWFVIKPKLKGRNFLWDLHAVVGTWVIVFYLLLACTGLFWSYDWWRNGMYKVMGVERPAPQMQGEGGKGPRDGENAKGPRDGENARGPRDGENARASRDGENARGPRDGENARASRDGADANLENRQGDRANLQGNENRSARSEQGRQSEQANNQRDPKEGKKGLSPEQVNLALTQTWTAIQTNLGHGYSSISLNIPKKPDGKLEITFVDPVVQHERARNKVSFDYKNAQFGKFDLYEDKKLNEKIMSSMLPVHRGSFFGPVYQFLVMLASLMMPLFFVTGWMLYLKRRKQKKLTLAARNLAPMGTLDLNATPWLIVYASQTGVAEQLAWRTASSLREASLPTSVIAIQKLTNNDLKNAQHIIFIASTYGTGEAPDLATSFSKKLMHEKLDLSHLSFAVLALGSKEYPESYCQFGHEIAAWLKENAAQALFPTVEVDNGNPADLQKWNTALAAATQLDLQEVVIEKSFSEWTLQQRDLLNPDSLGAPAFHIQLKTTQELTWQAGDIAEIQTANSINRVRKFLEKYHIDANTQLSTTGQTIAQALHEKDLSQELDFNDLDDLVAKLPLLPTREYSIASIPSQQVLALVIRQTIDENGELGLGSGFMTQHLALHDTVNVNIRTNEAFHLIEGPRPIICIGNGTGIAGLMSLLNARIEDGQAENWLIFGERQSERDYFFKDTIQSWQETGKLKSLDLAFSRDQEHKVYVHHKLRENADMLKQWLENGAAIYVCGSIQGMAGDVEQALIDILGVEKLDELREAKRYRRDVY